MIARSSIQQVMAVARVEETIQEYVNLKRRGVNMIGLCPFHNEKTPSFTVSPSKNLYKCFGCGKGGDSVRFLMEHEQLSFPEAIRFLAQRYNIELDEGTPEDQQKYEEEKKIQDSLYIINQYASEHYTEELNNNQIAKSYLKERGFLDSTIDGFKIGYADRDFKSFTSKALAKPFKKEFLQKLGLTTKKENDFFIDRIMFPIQNLSGKVIAFAGRVLKTKEKSPKYLNSPESEVYLKRTILYGIYQAKNAIRKLDNCIIVEGYTDVMSMFQNGVENVVASSGTSLTSEQVRLVKRFTDNITILYDGDQAGIKAAMRGLDIVLEQDMNVNLVVLPESEDPDSFIKANGKSGFDDYVKENAQDFILFKTNMLLAESTDDPVKKTKALREIVDSLANIRDTLKRSLYIKQCSQSLDVYESVLVKEVNRKISQKIKKKKQDQEREQLREDAPFPSNDIDQITTKPGPSQQEKFRSKDSDEYQEKDIVRVIMFSADRFIDEDTKVLEYIYSYIADVLDYFDNEFYKNIIKEAFNAQAKGEKVNESYFVHHEDGPTQKLALDLLSTPYEYAKWDEKGFGLVTQKMPEDNFAKDSLGAINRLLTRKFDDLLDVLKKRILETEEESEDRIILLKAVLNIQEQKKEIIANQGSIGIRKI